VPVPFFCRQSRPLTTRLKQCDAACRDAAEPASATISVKSSDDSGGGKVAVFVATSAHVEDQVAPTIVLLQQSLAEGHHTLFPVAESHFYKNKENWYSGC